MAIDKNYFFVDGSSLVVQIARLWDNHGDYKGKKLNVRGFVEYFTGPAFGPYHGNSCKRFTFYFPEGDPDLDRYFDFPDFTKPTEGRLGDIFIKKCGKKLPPLTRLRDAELLLEKNFPEAVEYLRRGEKGIDTQICCDALQLAALDKMDRLFLCTNDSDFVPLIKTLKAFGTNLSIFHLSDDTKLEKLIASEADSYHIVDQQQSLDKIFGVTREAPTS